MTSVSRKASLLVFRCFNGMWMNLGFNVSISMSQPEKHLVFKMNQISQKVLLSLVQLSVSGTQKTGFSSSSIYNGS